MKQPVTDVSDAKERLTSGKVPRNIVTTLGVVAAVLVGTLGYFYQSSMESDLAKQAEDKKAKKLQERTSTPDNGGLDQLIRQQQDEARKQAAQQAAEATRPEPAKAPVMTAKDFVQPATAGPAAAELKQANDLDTVMTSPIFKSDGKAMRRDVKRQPDLSGVVDPAQMRAQQLAAVGGMNGTGGVGGAGGMPGMGGPEGGNTAPTSSDGQFLRGAAATSFTRTGFAGKLAPCTVSQGFVIPATFVGGLNSDKPGEFRATVTNDVYDTVNGTCKAIPAGATLVGTYSSDIAIGQERILAAFVRMQLPNGKWVPLLGMGGADPNGYAGISGDVNNHFFKIFAGALIIGVLEQHFNDSATATTVGPNGLTTFGNTAGQVAAQTAQTILNRNQNIRPTITTKPGQKLLVQVKHDIVLEPYRD
ncbi:conjugal transfer protein TrbI (plasmid) [Cupriavidus necator N-1]|uniref:Conjugal transfer protein TrbI n=2 Tax=Cupriavidus necator TaxID=106590 RepID=F8GY61_CUPNN|nr:conjugal transfer protein TrbI [Cupriavidus necator N-1]